jgi:hypothetical protein
MPEKRAGKEQVEARVNDILRIMLDGAQPWDYVEYVREQEAEADTPWHVGEDAKPLTYSQIRRYVNKAEKRIEKAATEDRGRLLRRHLAKRANLYAKAVSQGDLRCALACLDSEARLIGLFPTQDDSPVKGRSHGTTVVNIFERVTLLAEQLKQLGTLDPGIPPGAVCGDGRGEPLDSPDAHGEADRISAAG